jgi:hypothetical protein
VIGDGAFGAPHCQRNVVQRRLAVRRDRLDNGPNRLGDAFCGHEVKAGREDVADPGIVLNGGQNPALRCPVSLELIEEGDCLDRGQ